MATQESYEGRQYVEKPLPLITPRIEFKPSPRVPLPTLTARTEFNVAVLCPLAEGLSISNERRLEVPRQILDNHAPLTISCRPEQLIGHTMVPKPRGEPGKPNSGGYSVEGLLIETYGWTKQQVDDLKVRTIENSPVYILTLTDSRMLSGLRFLRSSTQTKVIRVKGRI